MKLLVIRTIAVERGRIYVLTKLIWCWKYLLNYQKWTIQILQQYLGRGGFKRFEFERFDKCLRLKLQVPVPDPTIQYPNHTRTRFFSSSNYLYPTQPEFPLLVPDPNPRILYPTHLYVDSWLWWAQMIVITFWSRSHFWWSCVRPLFQKVIVIWSDLDHFFGDRREWSNYLDHI